MSKKILVLAIVLSLFYCKKETEETKMIVTSLYGDVLVNESKEVTVGRLVKQGDVIRTENGRVSLQNKEGAVLLIKEFSKIRVAELGKTSTKIDTINSSLLIKTGKLNAGNNFNIVTPTAVAGVRGTTFFVYSTRESTIVNSIEGAVAVGKPGSPGTVIEKKSVEIDAVSEKVISETYVPNISEVTDIVTIVNVSPENIEKASNGDTKDFNKEVEIKIRKAEADAIEIIKSPNFTSERKLDVVKSVVVLKNGTRIKGNIIYQTKEKVYILDEGKAVQEFEKNAVSSVEFL